MISIGNLSVGGTGKTPMVMHTLSVLRQAGLNPCVAMRGYTRGKGGRSTHVVAPDEADSYRRAFANLPLVAQPDRAAGLRALLNLDAHAFDCVVLDDGFQHRQIARGLDMVLVDATPERTPFADHCLPRGWLREPVTSLKRSSAIVLTHAELASGPSVRELQMQIKHAGGGGGGAVVAVTRHVWVGLKSGAGADGSEQMLPLDVLLGKRVLGCCAIGHPDAFAASLRSTAGGMGEVEMMVLPDHDPYAPATVKRLAERARNMRAEAIVVTDKDWSKLRMVPAAAFGCQILRPELALVFDSGQEVLDSMILAAARGES